MTPDIPERFHANEWTTAQDTYALFGSTGDPNVALAVDSLEIYPKSDQSVVAFSDTYTRRVCEDNDINRYNLTAPWQNNNYDCEPAYGWACTATSLTNPEQYIAGHHQEVLPE